MTDVCEHGTLRRKCPICERDAEIAELHGDIEQLKAEIARHSDALLAVYRAKYHQSSVENRKLRAEIERMQRWQDAALADHGIIEELQADNRRLLAEVERLRAALENIDAIPAYAILDEAGSTMAAIAREPLGK